MTRDEAIEAIEVISRGGDLTDDDLRTIVEDMYLVRNWAMLRMRLGVPAQKEQMLRALQVRLGRRQQIK